MAYLGDMTIQQLSRRQLALLLPAGLLAAEPEVLPPLPATFPTQPPTLAREMVGASHTKFDRVRELVGEHPSLAKAAWDWGFGDWETALGAASHVGNREIAEFLLSKGATPTLFSAAMLGQLDVVKALVASQPGVQRTKGPHSIPLLAHARAGGAKALAVLEYLNGLGDAGSGPVVALTDAEVALMAGRYRFGTGASEVVEIRVIGKNQLAFVREGADARNLIHLGERVFHPSGAEAVRIRFSETGGVAALSVHDPGVVLRASREK
jgi:hypothetical protein